MKQEAFIEAKIDILQRTLLGEIPKVKIVGDGYLSTLENDDQLKGAIKALKLVLEQ